jgi:hypothetical protein
LSIPDCRHRASWCRLTVFISTGRCVSAQSTRNFAQMPSSLCYLRSERRMSSNPRGYWENSNLARMLVRGRLCRRVGRRTGWFGIAAMTLRSFSVRCRRRRSGIGNRLRLCQFALEDLAGDCGSAGAFQEGPRDRDGPVQALEEALGRMALTLAVWHPATRVSA